MKLASQSPKKVREFSRGTCCWSNQRWPQESDKLTQTTELWSIFKFPTRHTGRWCLVLATGNACHEKTPTRNDREVRNDAETTRELKFLHLLLTTRLSGWDAGATGTPKVAKKRRGNQFCLEAANANDISGSNSQGRLAIINNSKVFWPAHHCWFTLLPQAKKWCVRKSMYFYVLSYFVNPPPLKTHSRIIPKCILYTRSTWGGGWLGNLENQISYPMETSSNPGYPGPGPVASW